MFTDEAEQLTMDEVQAIITAGPQELGLDHWLQKIGDTFKATQDSLERVRGDDWRNGDWRNGDWLWPREFPATERCRRYRPLLDWELYGGRWERDRLEGRMQWEAPLKADWNQLVLARVNEVIAELEEKEREDKERKEEERRERKRKRAERKRERMMELPERSDPTSVSRDCRWRPGYHLNMLLANWATVVDYGLTRPKMATTRATNALFHAEAEVQILQVGDEVGAGRCHDSSPGRIRQHYVRARNPALGDHEEHWGPEDYGHQDGDPGVEDFLENFNGQDTAPDEEERWGMFASTSIEAKCKHCDESRPNGHLHLSTWANVGNMNVISQGHTGGLRFSPYDSAVGSWRPPTAKTTTSSW
ncbi:hypothetical protein QBC39DRAFT_432978 [Podospora conica]|nr:hypothetical protein QBC39DRAFT_432978 [Schizothecium conicum]